MILLRSDSRCYCYSEFILLNGQTLQPASLKHWPCKSVWPEGINDYHALYTCFAVFTCFDVNHDGNMDGTKILKCLFSLMYNALLSLSILSSILSHTCSFGDGILLFGMDRWR